MKYYLKQQTSMLHEKGIILGENEEETFSFESKNVAAPELYLYQNDEAIGHVSTKNTLTVKKYEVYLGDELMDTVVEEPALFDAKLKMEKLGYRIKGNFVECNFDILDQDDQVLAHVQEEVMHVTRQYSVEVFAEDKENLLLLLVLAIFRFAEDSDFSMFLFGAAAGASIH